MHILLLIFVAIFVFVIFMQIRNFWVFKIRTKILDRSIDEYEELPSYHYMLCHFWIWDINKFKNKKK